MNEEKVLKLLEYALGDFIDADEEDEHRVEEVTVEDGGLVVEFTDGTVFEVTVRPKR